MPTVAVIGLGIMGSGIARNIQKAGFPLRVHNRTRDKAVTLIELGAEWAASPAEAAAGADVVLSVVADDAASRAVWLGEGGVLSGLAARAVAIECSTLSLDWVRELRERVSARPAHFVDAPLGGSKLAAQAGSLTLFVGADQEALDQAQSVLAAFAKDIIHFGPPGSGAAYKLINNMMGAIHVAALGDGLAMARRFGLDMEAVTRHIMVGAASSPMVKGKVERMVAGDHSDVHFALRHMRKDLTYALQAANSLGLDLPLAAAALEQYARAVERGLGDLDFAAVGAVTGEPANAQDS